MSNTPTLETERLILRKFTENDLEALYQIYRDPDVNRFLPWFPLQSMDEARKFFEDRYASLYAEPQAYAYAICLKRGNRPIGYVKVDMAEPHDFGYGLRPDRNSACSPSWDAACLHRRFTASSRRRSPARAARSSLRTPWPCWRAPAA